MKKYTVISADKDVKTVTVQNGTEAKVVNIPEGCVCYWSDLIPGVEISVSIAKGKLVKVHAYLSDNLDDLK